MHVGNVDAFIAGKRTAVLHLAVDLPALDPADHQLHQPVVHQHPAALAELLVKVLIGDRDLVLVTGHIFGAQGEFPAAGQGDGPVLKALDADFRPLGVQHGGHRSPQLVPDPLELGQGGEMALVCAVGKIEAGAVHPGQNQFAQGLLVVHGGPQGADHLCLSHHKYLLMGM